MIERDQSPIGPLLRAVNTIADRIKDEFAHVAIDTLAYTCAHEPLAVAQMPPCLTNLRSHRFRHPPVPTCHTPSRQRYYSAVRDGV